MVRQCGLLAVSRMEEEEEEEEVVVGGFVTLFGPATMTSMVGLSSPHCIAARTMPTTTWCGKLRQSVRLIARMRSPGLQGGRRGTVAQRWSRVSIDVGHRTRRRLGGARHRRAGQNRN
jgi:hypothetical protein